MKNKVWIFVLVLLVAGVVSGCTQKPAAKSSSESKTSSASSFQKSIQPKPTVKPQEATFTGEAGDPVIFENDQIKLSKAIFDDGKAHYYNVELDGDMVYFFVVKDKNGIYRAAGNACQVCADAKMGFRQEGNNMVCNTCGNKYPLEKIATEKGGCNPVPVNPNLKVIGNDLIIEKLDLKDLKGHF